MRKTFFFLIVLSLFTIISGCSKSANRDPSQSASQTNLSDKTEESFTLRVTYWAKDNNGYFRAVENKFKQKYPNSSITWEKLDEKTFADDTANQLKANQAADIIFNQSIKAYTKAGYLLDLSDQPWVDRMIDSAKQTVAFKEKTYGAALDVSTFGVYYNKKIFANLQLEQPKTWNDFVELCSKIKQSGISPIIGGFKDTWTIQGVYIPIAATAEFEKNPKFEMDLYEGKVKIDGPEVNGALNKFKQIAQGGFFNPDALTIGYEESTAQFIDGKGAMHLMGSWTPGVVDSKTKDFQMGFFALPDENGKTVMAAAPDKQVSINAKTAYPIKAKYLLSLLLDKDMLALYSKNIALSAFKDVIAEYTNPAMKEVQKALQLNPTSFNPGHLMTNSANDSINKALNQILLGKELQNELKEADDNYIKDKSTLILD
ncbi:extracellular solute-binding protein [Paenibacillus psychroresistens]|uniref:Extracellular solute-binding protein n=1 Tax=Paenibacillus psychroresistens TaxID=1778678 RepID=A0A6B8RUJ3_9BACL|nr:extracellular solute-binding protein [Paenibacillus psychroresistens]QGQ99492.1 extracellular solute-binding protein [Paenibacillus psychroresistens]